ncbi:uncharacterized protein BJX67DRAFT_3820 [Aspergillus lucknowensis]|uniref:Uncharacterized protein n=1 Tax=Aspergillus lucknowensis TaxID=176173 RepID=A0ABR4M6X1_9EURO
MEGKEKGNIRDIWDPSILMSEAYSVGTESYLSTQEAERESISIVTCADKEASSHRLNFVMALPTTQHVVILRSRKSCLRRKEDKSTGLWRLLPSRLVSASQGKGIKGLPGFTTRFEGAVEFSKINISTGWRRLPSLGTLSINSGLLRFQRGGDMAQWREERIEGKDIGGLMMACVLRRDFSTRARKDPLIFLTAFTGCAVLLEPFPLIVRQTPSGVILVRGMKKAQTSNSPRRSSQEWPSRPRKSRLADKHMEHKV